MLEVDNLDNLIFDIFCNLSGKFLVGSDNNPVYHG